jgi:hypothetical protein
MGNEMSKTQRPPYLLGLLCLIPLVGAFVGIGLLLYGIFKYKDKRLALIGAAGIAWTVVVYSSLFYTAKYVPTVKNGFVSISQTQIKEVVMNIEFYKLQNGQYPDSLSQLRKENSFVPITDAAQGFNSKGTIYYHYERVGEKYRLFSVGMDGIAGTKDDFYPDIRIPDSSRIGLIR